MWDYILVQPITHLTSSKYEEYTTDLKSYQDCGELLAINPLYEDLMGIISGLTALWELFVCIILLRFYTKRLALLSIACNEIDVLMREKSKKFKSKKNLNRHRKNQFFLSLAIKTTNIVILCVISGWIGIFALSVRVGEYWLVFDHIVGGLGIYMMYSDVLYKKIFCCNKICFNCCLNICYCCCLKPKNLPHHLQLELHKDNKMDKITTDVDENKETRNKANSNASSPTSDIDVLPVLTTGFNKVFDEHDAVITNHQEANNNVETEIP